jgi:hypothetical protein
MLTDPPRPSGRCGSIRYPVRIAVLLALAVAVCGQPAALASAKTAPYALVFDGSGDAGGDFGSFETERVSALPLDGGSPQYLTGGELQLDQAGTRAAFSARGRLWLVDLARAQVRTPVRWDGYRVDWGPHGLEALLTDGWSQDADLLVTPGRVRTLPGMQGAVLSPDGRAAVSGRPPLLATAAHGWQPVGLAVGEFGPAWTAPWSPDSRRFVLHRLDGVPPNDVEHLLVVDRRTLQTHEVVVSGELSGLAWARDSQHFAATIEATPRSREILVDARSGTTTTLLTGSLENVLPALAVHDGFVVVDAGVSRLMTLVGRVLWRRTVIPTSLSPDARRIVGQTTNGWLEVVDVRTGSVRRVRGPGLWLHADAPEAAWLPDDSALVVSGRALYRVAASGRAQRLLMLPRGHALMLEGVLRASRPGLALLRHELAGT